MITQESIQEVVSRIDIIDIISGFVRLKRRGANYLGLCPFHDEKTPSFTVSPAKEIYKCFGCGRSGNTITFLMEHEKFSYVEAIRWLAQKYQVELQETETSPEFKQQQLTADSLYAINNFAQKHFSANLRESEDGVAIGLSYLKHRGFREHIIDKFEIGYCLQNDSFAKAAIENQFNKELLLKSGLVTSRDGKFRDNYHGRIIFPVHNQTGKIVGFGARLIEKNDKAPKYINTPENEIYVKSKILYGLWQARQAIGKKDECILVEGYTDVVSLHQAGIENVVASGGTSLTHDQLRLIRKITPNLTIFYDGDAAGTSAAMRGIDLALEEGLNVKILSLPSPEDPDSYINKFGAAALEKYIEENKKDFILFQLDWAIRDAGDDQTKKTNAVKKIAESISKLNRPEDFIIRQDYIKKVSTKLNIEEQGFLSLINNITRENLEKTQKKFLSPPALPQELHTGNVIPESDYENQDASALLKPQFDHEKALVRCLLEYGLKRWEGDQTVAEYLLDEWEMEGLIEDETLSNIVQEYKSLYKDGENPDVKTFLYSESQDQSKTVVSIISFPYEISKNWEERYNQPVPEREDLYIADLTSVLRYIDLKNIKRLLFENEKDFKKELLKQTSEDRIAILLKTHQHLKSLELNLAKQVGMVILK